MHMSFDPDKHYSIALIVGLLAMSVIFVMLVMFVIFALPVKPQLPKTPPVQTQEILPIKAKVLENLVNKWRVDNGYRAFVQDTELCQYAEERATEIKLDWSHDQFSADRCAKSSWHRCGENLVRNATTEDWALQAWLNSPTHLRNLKDNYTAMCIACSDNYCAQEFGGK